MHGKNKWWTIQFIPHGKGDIQSYNVKFLPIILLCSFTLLITLGGIGAAFFLWDTTQKLDDRLTEQQTELTEYMDENHELKLRLSNVNLELNDLHDNLQDLQRYIEEVQQLEMKIKELDPNATSLQSLEQKVQRTEQLLKISSVSVSTPEETAFSDVHFSSVEFTGTNGASTQQNTLKAKTETLTESMTRPELLREQIIALQNEAKVQQNQLSDLKDYIEEEQYKALFIPSIPPSDGKLTSRFGYRKDPFHGSSRMHKGLDFSSSHRSPVYATAHGTVKFTGRNGNYGKQIVIDHGNGYETSYAHLASISVEVGDEVEKGDEIGKMGSTGRSTGVHVHYELHKDGKPIDPYPYIK